MRTFAVLVAFCPIATLAAGCGRDNPNVPEPSKAAETRPPSMPVHESPAKASSAAKAPPPVSGKVLERIDSAGYSYLRLETATGEEWAAVATRANVDVGAEITVLNPSRMDGFVSKTLNRTFERIVFGALAGDPGILPPHGSPGAGIPTSMPSGNASVEKAAGPDAVTVAALMAKKPDQLGKSVAVRGRVVKYSQGIMGRNWVHLQDGTGSEAEKNHDLTVTTNDVAAVGDVIVVRGKVSHDKSFGAGYDYPVILEEAHVEK